MLVNILRWIVMTAVSLFLAFLLVISVGFQVTVSDAGMENIAGEGQKVLVNRLSYRLSSPSRQDCVAYYPGGDTDLAPLVGRIVALPGETVQIVDGVLLINGVPDAYSRQTGQIAQPLSASRMITLDVDEYYILEDNRNETNDSRNPVIGPVKEDQIIGHVWAALWSEGKMLRLIH